MKKLLPFVCGAMLFLGCADEKDVDPAERSTFMRFLGSDHNHTAVLATEDREGGEYALLANMDIKVNSLGDFAYKIRLFKMTENGSLLNTFTFPEFPEDLQELEEDKGGPLDGYIASSFIQLPGDEGYLIIGESIYKSNGASQRPPSRLLLMRVSPEGVYGTNDIALFSSDLTADGQETSLHGRAVTEDVDGNYLILGNITLVDNQTNTVNDMYVAKINRTDFSIMWKREYGGGEGKVANRIFTKNADVTWGGSVQFVNSSDVRLINVPQNSQPTSLGGPIGDPSNNEVIYDFCPTLGGYAFVGSTLGDVTATKAQDIYFTKLSPASTTLFTAEPIDFGGLNDRAVSVTDAIDGGYMILATVTSGLDANNNNAPVGNGAEDLLLLRLDHSGKELSRINYGGPDAEEGASIRTTRDGKSYLVFGTTSFGDMRKLMLMKVGSDGILR